MHKTLSGKGYVKDGRQVDGAVREPVCRKTSAMAEL